VTETLWRLTATGGSQTKARSRTATRGHPAQAVKATTSSSVPCARNVRAYLRHSARRDEILAADRERCQSLRGEGRGGGRGGGGGSTTFGSSGSRGRGEVERAASIAIARREGNEREKVKRSGRKRTRRGGALASAVSCCRFAARTGGRGDGSVCLTWWVQRCVGPHASE
jgi:hypothetical protein